MNNHYGIHDKDSESFRNTNAGKTYSALTGSRA